MVTLDNSLNYTQVYDKYQSQHTDFETSQQVTLTLENNFTITKSLNDAVILLNSRILSYLQAT